ncbi:MAG: Fic family protein [Ilumatobacteraceae bacterium]
MSSSSDPGPPDQQPTASLPGVGGWPKVAYETLEWQPSLTTGRLAELVAGSYAAAVPPIIATLIPQLGSDIVEMSREASFEIARFDSELGAEIGPFASILLRSESASSSQIEHLTASAKNVLMAEAGDVSRRNATEIASNTAAMNAAVSMATDITDATILAMHHALLHQQRPEWAGRWRDQPVWIGGRATSPHGAGFVPPEHSRIPALISDLTAFARRTDIDPLVKALLAHAQFETIHPFPDGNGRTGRALIHSMLRHDNLTRTVTVPVSAGLLSETDRYFQSLTDYREGDPNSIVELGAHATLRAVTNGRQLAQEMDATRADWATRLRGVRRDATAWRLVETLIEHPVTDANTIAEHLGISTVAARTAIAQLVDVGILRQANAGLRFRKWIATDVADALDRFAERAGRRTSTQP